MKENEVVMIPFVAHESAMNRMERANKRLWIVILVMFIGKIIQLIVKLIKVQENNKWQEQLKEEELLEIIKEQEL